MIINDNSANKWECWECKVVNDNGGKVQVMDCNGGNEWLFTVMNGNGGNVR